MVVTSNLTTGWATIYSCPQEHSDYKIWLMTHLKTHTREKLFTWTLVTLVKSQEHGDYKICFDNSFSYLSSKTVYFEILNENEDEDYDELRDIFGDDDEVDAEYYEVSVAEIEVGWSWWK